MSTPSGSALRLLGAVQDGSIEIVRRTLADDEDAPQSLQFVDEHGMTPLMTAAMNEGNAELIEALLDGEKVQAEINYQSPKVRTQFHSCVHACK